MTKYLEVDSCPVRGVLSLRGENDYYTLNMECCDYYEVTEEELKEWLPIINKYHDIIEKLDKRKSIYGSPENIKENKNG